MGTATSSGLAAGLVAALLALSGCGGGGGGGAAGGAGAGAKFAWLQPAPPPAGWRLAAIPVGATLPYPPAWRTIKSDPGTASAALFDHGDHFAGYLNLTPRQGSETLAGWARFRVAHNADEHERNVTALAAATGLRFRTGRGSCVRDAYTTTTGGRYVELACLVEGRRASVVVVGASPPGRWNQVAPLIERAISSLAA